jgi:hypothetical protein
MLSVMPVQKRSAGADAGRSVNLGFHCALAAGTEDPRGILKNCRRDDRGIKYSVTVNMGAYQAMAAAMNLVSLAEMLTEINRQFRLGRFRESAGITDSVSAYRNVPARRSAAPKREFAGERRGSMRLHNNDRNSG